MSTRETDERAALVKGQAGYLAFQVMSFVLIAEMGATEWMPGLLAWHGFPVGYLLPVLAGALVFLGYSLARRTVGSGYAKTAAIAFGIGFVVAVVLAISRQRLF